MPKAAKVTHPPRRPLTFSRHCELRVQECGYIEICTLKVTPVSIKIKGPPPDLETESFRLMKNLWRPA
eukprot:3839827-Prymnesium_polylepis.1